MEGLPAGITGDSATYPLPQSESVTYGETVTVKGGPYPDFNVVDENGVTVGTWSFLYWEYNGSQYTAGNTLTMPQDSSVEFVGIWKYTDKLTTLTVKKEGYESIDINQTFIFRITGDAVDLTVTVHGNSFVTVSGLTAGKSYTVTELNEWSWRYGLEKWSFTDGNSSIDGTNNEAQVTLGAGENVITFTNKRLYDKWLDGDAYKVNTFENNEG